MCRFSNTGKHKLKAWWGGGIVSPLAVSIFHHFRKTERKGLDLLHLWPGSSGMRDPPPLPPGDQKLPVVLDTKSGCGDRGSLDIHSASLQEAFSWP